MTNRIRHRLVALLVIVCAVVALEQAFERLGALALVRAPNARRTIPPAESGERRIDVGPPSATLSVSVIEPRLPPRATIVVLHGIRDQKDFLRHVGLHLAEAGYRAVLVDSRGHGHSTGQYLTWGVQEPRDLTQVIDALGYGDGPIGVFGESYGAAMSIMWAAHDPRVRAVVAVAPFSSLREIVPDWWKLNVPLIGRMIPRFVLNRSIDEGARMARFDPDASSPKLAATRSRAPILIVHGSDDNTVPYDESVTIARAAPATVKLVTLDGQDHDHIASDPRLMSLTLDFYSRVFK
ncbi:MAG: acetoin dehydrogenase subunit dihydrolipoyllysine-residue acetyltransferase [Myxococcales bacterium]|nr:acetoin dehydrogenase subunit dihydrolipoyllysine-residue acetyltransferase [Myxococcales bacterium]